ncbi:MAG: hypothetical protein ABJA60_09605, partial [Nitrosospira sp.]
MNNRIIGIGLIALVSSWPVSAASTQADPQQRSAVQLQSHPLVHGDGWRLVRSIELGNSGNYVHMVLID